ncbi:hypothetical protein ACFXJ8_39220 [Nonomuraea sp. NPDC059194]|uniref:hypothetical protein n=1 Tax=Nonomuraea sp. NPDC059194 TaxID=3346764 RepID=UPI0036D1417F
MAQTTASPATLPELIAALQSLAGLAPLDRARRAPELIEAAKGVLADARAVACLEASQAMPQVEISRRLGISRSKISEAISRGRALIQAAGAVSAGSAASHTERAHARTTARHSRKDP